LKVTQYSSLTSASLYIHMYYGFCVLNHDLFNVS